MAAGAVSEVGLPTDPGGPIPTALVRQQWSEGLEAEALKKISYTGLISKRSTSIIQWKDTLSNKPGQKETFGLRMQLTRAPYTTGTALEDAEQSISVYHDSITLDEASDAVRFQNVYDRQMVDYDMRDEARAALSDQLAASFDTSFFNQVAQNDYVGTVGSAVTGTFRGNNALTAADSDHILFQGADANVNDVLTNTTGLDITTIAKAVERAKSLSPSIRPATIEGWPTASYVLFISPEMNTALRTTDSRWENIMLAAMQGGQVNSNPLIDGALGVVSGVLICETQRLPWAIDNTDTTSDMDQGDGTGVKNAVLLGAQAAGICWGRLGGTPDRFRWVEKHFEYDREFGVLAGCMYGIKKFVFDSKDFGSLVIPTYVAAA
jgi:N4-gp56 family major capsid protein